MRECDNALATSLGLAAKAGPEISQRTLHTCADLPSRTVTKLIPQCFAHIRKRVNEHPDSDLIRAQRAFIRGRKKAEQREGLEMH